MRRYLFLFLCICVAHFTFAQGARIILNGAYINLEDSVEFVIDNPNSNAITRTASGGHFISENEHDVIKWNVGSNNANYKVPFGMPSGEYLPLEFTTSGGSGSGYFELATYGGSNYLNSSYLPSGISNFNGFMAADNSPYVMDRFWKVKARDYDSGNNDRPNLDFLLISYLEDEYNNVGNAISENAVDIQRYNPVLDSWYDYIPGGLSQDTTNNTISVSNIPQSELFDWWVISDKISLLPIELSSFEAKAVDNKIVQLDWETRSEINSDKFEIQRSKDGINWEYVLEVKAAGMSSQPITYQNFDLHPYFGASYYRLKSYDIDKTYTYSKIRTVEITEENNSMASIVIYPNPTVGVLNIQFPDEDFENKILKVYSVNGQEVIQRSLAIRPESNKVVFDVSTLPQGSYILEINSDDETQQVYKFVKL